MPQRPEAHTKRNTPQTLFNTIVEVHANFRESYAILAILRVRCIVL